VSSVTRAALVLCALVAAALAPDASLHAQTARDAALLAREGRALSPQQVSRLEDGLNANPDDLQARARLLGYYFAASSKSVGIDGTRAARRRHILWIVEHHPESAITTLAEMTIDRAGHALADPDAYEAVRTLWLAQVDRRGAETPILLHAARFFRLPDRALALDLLKRAVRQSPSDVDAAAELGSTYAITILGITMINGNGLPMGADPAMAAGALAQQSIDEVRSSSNLILVKSIAMILAQYAPMAAVASKGAIDRDALAEEMLQKAEALDPADAGMPRALGSVYHLRWARAPTPAERVTYAKKELQQAELSMARMTASADAYLYLESGAAKAAVEANEIDRARQLATDALDRVGSRNDNATGPFIHDAHVVLGRVALRAGSVADAKTHLLQAGRITGGGSLTSFGPNMSLAKELLERGERDTVVSYLEECVKFWSFGGAAQRWIDTIKAGGTPNFGANLIY
jgi:tetratricopeptide (TPR) repeat protein